MHDFRDRQLTLQLGSSITSMDATDTGRAVMRLSNSQVAQTDMLLYAAGRVGATDDLGLEGIGLAVDSRGRLAVKPETLQTSVPHIYAAGDVIGLPSLASTSVEQGRLAACHAFGVTSSQPSEGFPYGIYSVPEISTVGR